jgi:hypothetical protein
VKWRTGRNRHPIWKSMVLPAGGVTLVPGAGDDRAAAALRQRAQLPLDGAAGRPAGPGSACLLTPGMSRAAGVALESQGGWKVDAVQPPPAARCEILILPRQKKPPDASWLFVARERRVRSEDDIIDIYSAPVPAR